tara:strand:+ start:569 stop:1012 length:444 start_codon:yes stop_codon:yes gene_type:complete
MKKKNKSKAILKLKELSATKPRMQVLDILLKNNSPMSIDEIIKETKNDIAISSAYRVIADLMDVNIVNTFQSPDNKLLVELAQDGTSHHHHLYCASCKKATDIELDTNLEENINQLINKISKKNNITITDHSFELYGTCDSAAHHKS